MTKNSKPYLAVFHGGPGLTPLYLQEFLKPLQTKYQMLWFDAYGWKEENLQPTVKNTLNFVLERLQHCDEKIPLNLLGHSFGTHLVLELLKEQASLAPQTIILSNPFPLTWERLTTTTKSMAKRIIELLTPSELKEWRQLDETFSAAADQRYLELCRPLYVADQSWVTKLHWGPYLRRQAMAMMGQLSGYNQLPTLQRLPKHTLVIRGEKDFFTVHASQELDSHAKKVTILPNVGHSPFIEANAIFLEHIMSLQ